MSENRWIWVLVFPMTLLLCLGGIPAMQTDPIPGTAVAIFYYAIIYVAQNFLFALILSVFLWVLSLVVPAKRIRSFLFVLIASLFILFFLLSAKVFSFWHFYVNADVFQLFFSKGGGTNVFEVSQGMVIAIVISITLFFLLGWVVIYFARRFENIFSLKFLLIAGVVIYVVAQGMTIYFVKNNFIPVLQYTTKVPYFMELSWANALDRLGVPVFPEYKMSRQLRTILSNNNPLHYPLRPLQYHVPAHPLNVLIIAIDTLRYDMVNPMNMPHVYQFSEQADQFTNEQSGGDCTSAGIFSLFYGIPATYWNSAIVHQQGSIIIRAFQDNHYQFKLLGSAGFLSPPFTETVFLGVPHLDLMTKGETPFSRDLQITKEMQIFLHQRASDHHPFFGFVFYDGPHAYNSVNKQSPFHPTASMNYLWVNNHTNRIPLFNLYKNAVLADDQLVEKLLQTLKSTRLLSNTIVVITADHGQEFNEYHNNYWEHPSGFSQYQMHVPMIITWPGKKRVIYTYKTSHFDLAPTLLHRVLGVSNPSHDYSVGDDLYTPHNSDFVIAGQYGQYALVASDYVMPFYNSGLYRFTDRQMRPIYQTQLDSNMKKLFFDDMQRFY